MLPGQIKAFGVGVLLCRNDLYKNAVRYTLLWPPNNFITYAELAALYRHLQISKAVLAQLKTD